MESSILGRSVVAGEDDDTSIEEISVKHKNFYRLMSRFYLLCVTIRALELGSETGEKQ